MYYGCGCTDITFVKDRVYLLYGHYPEYTSMMRFDVEPGYSDLRLTALPVAWFYRRG